MAQEFSRKTLSEPLLAAWIKWTMDFWDTMAQMGPGLAGGQGSREAEVSGDAWLSSLNLWQAFFSLLTEPETVAAVFEGIKAPSEIILRMAQAGWGGYSHLHAQWLQGWQGSELPVGANNFENLDQDIFKTCNEIYEHDFGRLLNLPQLCLTGLPQERVNRATEKFNYFQAAMAEFIYLLYLPVKKSLRAMGEERRAAMEEKPPVSFKEYYKRWLKILEGYYMTLFQSGEYTRTLSRTLYALEEFTTAKQNLVSQALEALGLPTRREMDEIYREMYLLKKQAEGHDQAPGAPGAFPGGRLMDRPKIPVDLILAKLAAEAEETKQRLEKARDIFLGPLATDIGTTPYEMLYQEDRVRLKYYRPEAARLKTPLLLVHGLFNRETLLDLQPDRSVVRNLLKEGVEVYLIEWGSPSRRDQFLTLDDHINGYMDNIVNFIRRRQGIPQVNLMGVCMGGTFGVIYAALHPEKIRNLITTVAPTQFDTSKALLHVWLKEIDVDRLVHTFGNLPGNLVNAVLLLLNPPRLLLDKYLGFLENMDNKDFVENFIRMEKWIFDSPDVPGETIRQVIKDLYQENLLVQGKLVLEDCRVDLLRITMPLLNIYGQYDHLVPPEACAVLTEKVGSQDTENICLDTGHVGIYVSTRFQKEMVPKIAAWLLAREG